MNILEFENTQGITLRYNTASVFERGASYVLDMVVLGVSITLLSLIFRGAGGIYTYYIIMVPVFVFYSLWMEMLNEGRSVGKMILGLKVVRVDGKYPVPYDYFMRWIFRWLDIYMSMGALAALMVSASPRNQRVGDMLADTTVIRTRNLRVPLGRVLNLSNLSNYEPKYPQARDLKEAQVLIAREALQRANKYKNEAHFKVVADLGKRMASVLGVEPPKNSSQFLHTVIKDYIALTR